MMSLQIRVNIDKQTLRLLDDGELIKEYAVSTGKAGAGERNGSLQTPRGRHLRHAANPAEASSGHRERMVQSDPLSAG